MNAYCQHDLVYPQCPICKGIEARYTVRSIEQRETVNRHEFDKPISVQADELLEVTFHEDGGVTGAAVKDQPANLLLEDEDKPMYTCKFCGAPSERDPSEQEMPPDYCHPEDHKDFE